MPSLFSRLAVIRTRREMVAKVGIATIGIVAATDALDAVINLYSQPDRLWPSFVQTTFTAAFMSLLFLSALANANLRLFRLKESFEALAMTDVQTGLLNRRGFFATLEKAHAPQRDATLLIFDIDYFKRINDGHGHLVGDYVIAEVGKTLNALLSPPHFVGRVGGEEFAVALRAMSPAEAFKEADRIRWSISRLAGPPLPDGLKVTTSVGVARIGEDTVMDGFSRADKALYEAKGSGRNRCVSADYTPPSNVLNLPVSNPAERA